MCRQRTARTDDRLDKLRRNHIRALRRRMRVIIGIERIHRRSTQSLKLIRNILTVINRFAADDRGGQLDVRREAVRGVREGAGLPWVVWCWGCEDDGGA